MPFLYKCNKNILILKSQENRLPTNHLGKIFVILQSVEIKQNQELQKLRSYNIKGLGNNHN